MAHLVMLVILHVNVITYQNFNLSHIYHIFAKNLFFEMKFLKLVTLYPNMVQTIWNDIWFNILSTFIKN